MLLISRIDSAFSWISTSCNQTRRDLPICDVWLDNTQHGKGGLGDSDERRGIEVFKLEQAKNFGRQSAEAPGPANAHHQHQLGIRRCCRLTESLLDATRNRLLLLGELSILEYKALSSLEVLHLLLLGLQCTLYTERTNLASAHHLKPSE
jgi:hypothetical protein